MEKANTACFAINEKGECKALDTGKYHDKKCICTGSETCAFYRSAQEHRASCDAANARLRSLPNEQQIAIAETYFCGWQPWATE
jgi:hypothetical protein